MAHIVMAYVVMACIGIYGHGIYSYGLEALGDVDLRRLALQSPRLLIATPSLLFSFYMPATKKE